MALKVEVVSRERVVWTGEAKYVRARSVSGDLGILPGMIPTCTLLAQDGELLIEPVEGEVIKTVPEDQIVETLIEEATRIAAEMEASGEYVPEGSPAVSVS